LNSEQGNRSGNSCRVCGKTLYSSTTDVTFVIAYSRILYGGITGAYGAPRISIDKVYQLPKSLFFLEVFYEQVL